DAGAAHRCVLEIDRADPFAARLDHVLRAVGDHHRAVLLDLADIAGGEPVLVEELALAVAFHVALHDPRPAHHQVARDAAVLRQVVAGIVDDLHLAAEHRAAGLGGDGEALGVGQAALAAVETRRRAERAHLGHAPALHDLDAMLFPEALDHRDRHCGASD